ncbi:MAG: ribose-5-phosphate isomerase RpiA [Acidobacteria bacterium]|nr:ribose-5-phosphate isomerase RpiA [Acidobacteriota bacterium]
MEKNRDAIKKHAAQKAVEFVCDGQLVGLGTGSTTWFALQALGTKVQQGLRIQGVATSLQSEKIAQDLGIPLTTLNDIEKLDVSIDGADEVNPDFHMIKGGGGALTREKLVALSATQRIFVIDAHKQVVRLGEGFAVPVEVLPFAWKKTVGLLAALGCEPRLRERHDRAFETDNGNYIVDCRFAGIDEVAQLERRLKLLPGVVESGLFVGLCDVLIIGSDNDVEVRYCKAKP